MSLKINNAPSHEVKLGTSVICADPGSFSDSQNCSNLVGFGVQGTQALSKQKCLSQIVFLFVSKKYAFHLHGNTKNNPTCYSNNACVWHRTAATTCNQQHETWKKKKKKNFKHKKKKMKMVNKYKS